MSQEKLPYERIPKVPFDRRAWAFIIDFVLVWILSSLVGTGLIRWLVFFLAWLALKVLVVVSNQGQSLGCWALDLKVIDFRFKRVPQVVTLIKRESILGGCALLAMIGLEINFANSLTMLLLLGPVIADCALAFTDEELGQAFHDRVADTIIIQTPRGFSLDLQVKKLLAEVRYRVRR